MINPTVAHFRNGTAFTEVVSTKTQWTPNVSTTLMQWRPCVMLLEKCYTWPLEHAKHTHTEALDYAMDRIIDTTDGSRTEGELQQMINSWQLTEWYGEEV